MNVRKKVNEEEEGKKCWMKLIQRQSQETTKNGLLMDYDT